MSSRKIERRLGGRSVAVVLVLCFGLERPAIVGAQTDGQVPALDVGLERVIAGLEAAGRRDEARAVVRRWLARRPSSRAAFDAVIRLERAAGKLGAAFAYSGRRVRLASSDPEVLAAHIELALARGKPTEGFETARRLAAVRGTRADRILYARMAEWSGRPDEALDEWWRLARAREPTALREVQRLARIVGNERILRSLAFRRLARDPSNTVLVEKVSGLSEALGEPEAARRALIRAASRRGAPKRVLVRLARLEARMGRSRSALARWAAVARRFGTDADEDIERADLAWATLGPMAALAILDALGSRGLANPEVARRVAHLGAMVGDRPAAIRASRALLHGGRLDGAAALRFVKILWSEGQPAAAIDVVEKVLARSEKDPSSSASPGLVAQLLLRGLEIGRESGLFTAAHALVSRWPLADEVARGWPAYWQVRANIALALGLEDEAAFAVQNAIALDPSEPSARADILWLLVQLKDRSSLSAWVRRTVPGAESESLLFEPLAAAFDRLGRPLEALPWYARRARFAPTSWRFWQRYAEALERSGRQDAALRAREYGLAHVRPEEPVGRILLGRAKLSEARRIRLARALAFDDTQPLAARRAAAWALTESSDLAYASLACERLAVDREPHVLHDARLHIAVATRDRARVVRLLESELKPGPVVEAETQAFLGRFDRALAVALRNRTDRTGVTGRGDVLRYLTAEADRRPNDVKAAGTYARLGDLEMLGTEARVRVSMESWTLGLSARAQTFADRAGAAFGLEVDGDFRGMVSVQRRLGSTRIGLSAGVHDQIGGRAIPQVELTLQTQVTGRLELSGRAAAFEVAPETPLQYTLMMREQFALGGVLHVHPRLTLSGRGSLELYRVREGDVAALGATGRVRVAGMLVPETRHGGLEMYVEGLGVRRDAVARVPGRLALLDRLEGGVEALVAPSFVTTAVGVRFARGASGARGGGGARLRYTIDGSIGWQAPLDTPAYWLEAGLGVPLLGTDELYVRGFAGNVLAGLSDIRAGLRVGYRWRFAL